MKIKMPAQAAKVIQTLEQHGFEAYIVGGCVRDSILGRTPGDWDITTSASPQKVKEIFDHTVDTGIEHGTVTVLMNHEPYEVTTYRVDGKYEDHRRPNEVHFTKSLREDLLRRDFTINAMAYNDSEGIIDMYDIMMETPQNNPHHKYNVGIHTIEAMKQIKAEHIYRWTMLLHDVGKPTARVEGPDKDHFKMHPVIGEEMARKILRRLKFDNQTIKQVTTLVRWHDRRFASIEEVNKKTVRRWVSQLTSELFTRLMEVQKADISAQSDYQRDKKEQVLQETKKLFEEIIEEKNCLSIKELKINGKDLMDMGVPQGKEIGQILSWLLDQVLEDPQLNERETLTRMAEEKRDEK